ncbi:MAG TPA: DUF456 domain-containing protein, partial [Lacipirellulaceae bacterium]|nr:DUF456 domain-containing protein [Lacipirellulaceae bacterium]
PSPPARKRYNVDMDATLYYLWALLLVAACVIAWLLSLVALPGNWIVLGFAALFAWLFPQDATGRGMTWFWVGSLGVLAVLGEIIEFVAGAAGAARQGASRRGVALSIVGAILGSIVGLTIGTPIPILGSFVMALLGGAAGAFAGAYLGEAWKGRPQEERVAAGRGAFAGRIWGTVGKLAVGAIMVAIVAWDAFL